MEHTAYRALACAERAQRAAVADDYRRAHGHRPRRGRPLKAASDPQSVQQALTDADLAIRRADGIALLPTTVRAVLRPLDPLTGCLHRPAVVSGDLQTAAALLPELGGRAADAAALLEQRAAGLVAYLEEMEAQLHAPRAVLGDEVVTFLAWA